jgi:hypothetical protein
VKVQNWLRPCPIRDDFEYLRKAALETNARPTNRAAADALRDTDFRRQMVENAERYGCMSVRVWEREFAEPPAEKP